MQLRLFDYFFGRERPGKKIAIHEDEQTRVKRVWFYPKLQRHNFMGIWHRGCGRQGMRALHFLADNGSKRFGLLQLTEKLLQSWKRTQNKNKNAAVISGNDTQFNFQLELICYRMKTQAADKELEQGNLRLQTIT